MTKSLWRVVVGLAVVAMLGEAAAQPHDWRLDRMALQESLRLVEPWFRPRWLAENGLQDWFRSQSHKPESAGIRCVGRWSYGPAVKVSLRVTDDDTIVCLARGSGASIIRFRSRDSLSLDLLSDIDCNGIVSRAIIRDSLVFCGMQQGGTGIEVWDVRDLARPERLSYVFLPPTMDIAVQDTLLFAIGYVQDSLRIFSVADPRNPRQVGACSDSGFPMCVSGNYCYLADRGGVNIVDVSDPAHPHRIGRAGSGGTALSVAVRDTLLFFGLDDNTLRIYSVADPAGPRPLGSVSGTLPADLYLPPTCDTVLYTPRLEVINITNPASPRIIGQVACPGWDYGVTTVPALNYALVADYFDGLAAVDITAPRAPALDTLAFAAGSTEDICIDRSRAYLAQYWSGMRILDVSDPTRPLLLGQADTAGTYPPSRSVVARDSFAYIGWSRVPYFRSFDVSDPSRPLIQGGCDITNRPEDMAIRDSFVYIAEDSRFQVVNVARPREPRLVGSCVLPGDVWDMALEDTLAYVTSTSLVVVNVARPGAPAIVGTWDSRVAVDVRDTIAFSIGRGAVWAMSAADPSQPYVLDTVSIPGWVSDIVLADTVAYAGGQLVYVVDIRDPRNLRIVGNWTPPSEFRRLLYSEPYLYAACYDAGVCILEATLTGVAESHRAGWSTGRALRLAPNPTAGKLRVLTEAGSTGDAGLRVVDVTGREARATPRGAGDNAYEADVTGLAPGVYFLEVKTKQDFARLKFVVQ